MAEEHLCGLDMDSSPSMTMKLSASVSYESPFKICKLKRNRCVSNLKWDTNVEDCPYYTRCTVLSSLLYVASIGSPVNNPIFNADFSCQRGRITVPFEFIYCQPRQPASQAIVDPQVGHNNSMNSYVEATGPISSTIISKSISPGRDHLSQ